MSATRAAAGQRSGSGRPAGTGGRKGGGTAGSGQRGAPRREGELRRAAADGSWVERVVAGDTQPGHRGRWGVAWFVVACAAAGLGTGAVAVLFAALAGAAGLQTAAAWRRARHQPIQLVAGAGGAVLPLAGALGIGLVGLASVGFAAAAVVVAIVGQAAPSRRAIGPLASAGLALRCGWVLAVGAAAAVLVARTDMVAFVVLLVLVSAYEVGDYLVGTGAANPVVGPLAGIVAVGVFTFTLSVFQFGPFDTRAAWVFGGLAAVLTPLGPIVASTLVPTAAAGGPALRRLDSWLLVAPVWAWMLWDYLG